MPDLDTISAGVHKWGTQIERHFLGQYLAGEQLVLAIDDEVLDVIGAEFHPAQTTSEFVAQTTRFAMAERWRPTEPAAIWSLCVMQVLAVARVPDNGPGQASRGFWKSLCNLLGDTARVGPPSNLTGAVHDKLWEALKRRVESLGRKLELRHQPHRHVSQVIAHALLRPLDLLAILDTALQVGFVAGEWIDGQSAGVLFAKSANSHRIARHARRVYDDHERRHLALVQIQNALYEWSGDEDRKGPRSTPVQSYRRRSPVQVGFSEDGGVMLSYLDTAVAAGLETWSEMIPPRRVPSGATCRYVIAAYDPETATYVETRPSSLSPGDAICLVVAGTDTHQMAVPALKEIAEGLHETYVGTGWFLYTLNLPADALGTLWWLPSPPGSVGAAVVGGLRVPGDCRSFLACCGPRVSHSGGSHLRAFRNGEMVNLKEPLDAVGKYRIETESCESAELGTPDCVTVAVCDVAREPVGTLPSSEPAWTWPPADPNGGPSRWPVPSFLRQTGSAEPGPCDVEMHLTGGNVARHSRPLPRPSVAGCVSAVLQLRGLPAPRTVLARSSHGMAEFLRCAVELVADKESK